MASSLTARIQPFQLLVSFTGTLGSGQWRDRQGCGCKPKKRPWSRLGYHNLKMMLYCRAPFGRDFPLRKKTDSWVCLGVVCVSVRLPNFDLWSLTQPNAHEWDTSSRFKPLTQWKTLLYTVLTLRCQFSHLLLIETDFVSTVLKYRYGTWSGSHYKMKPVYKTQNGRNKLNEQLDAFIAWSLFCS